MLELLHPPTAAAETSKADCADIIVRYLERLGVDTVFGVPGGAMEPFFNALARSQRRGGPRLVVARHECGAAFMADGYYRETGKMGVVCSTTGPGATNLLTGLASAMMEEIPLLALTAQAPLPKFGRQALQDSSCMAVDTVAIFNNVTRYSSLVSHPEQLEHKLINAVNAALRTPGPVHLSIPADILRSPQVPKDDSHSRLLTQAFYPLDEQGIAELLQRLMRTRQLVIYLGSHAGQAGSALQAVIELTQAAVIASPTGKAWIDEQHPQYHGIYGFAGHSSANELLSNPEVDTILAVGASLSELETRSWNSELLNHKLIHLAANQEHFSRSTMAQLQVYGHLGAIFSRLQAALRHGDRPRAAQAAPKQRGLHTTTAIAQPHPANTPLKPQYLMQWLNQQLPSDTRLFIDAGNSWAWATHYLSSNGQGNYRIAMQYGSMAWAMPAAIGSAAANPHKPTACLLGDGSFLMGGQEITVAAQLQLPVVFIVLNDAAMGMVMHGQRLGAQESIGWELNKVDYAALVQAMGISAHVIETAADLAQVSLAKLFAERKPCLLDVRIDPAEVPPMGDRIKGLNSVGGITPGS